MKWFIKILADFYKNNSKGGYIALGIALVFIFLQTIGDFSSYVLDSTDYRKGMILLSIVVTGLSILFVLFDILLLGVRPSPSYSQLIVELNKNQITKDLLSGRITRIKSMECALDENEMVTHIEVLMRIVHKELRHLPVLHVTLLFLRVLGISILYSLLSMNLTFYTKSALFYNLGLDSSWLDHLYNTITGMFLVGYDSLPLNDLGSILGIIQIFSGIFCVVVAIDFVLTGWYQDMNSVRLALRNYIILESTPSV